MTKQNLEPEQAAYWEKVYREMPLEVLTSVKEGARQLITITSALQGLYFVAISFGDIRLVITDLHIFVLLLPLVPWLLCLALAVSIFVPLTHHLGDVKPSSVEQAFRQAASMKLRRLHIAHWLLVLSMVLLFVDIVLYLVWLL